MGQDAARQKLTTALKDELETLLIEWSSGACEHQSLYALLCERMRAFVDAAVAEAIKERDAEIARWAEHVDASVNEARREEREWIIKTIEVMKTNRHLQRTTHSDLWDMVIEHVLKAIGPPASAPEGEK